MKTSYSAEGEDILIQKLLERCFYMDDHSTGTYVDVGAYHPWINSNTAALFLQGWSGVNIDARPGSMEEFKRERPGDVNVECAVGAPGRAMFYLMDRPELSTMSRTMAGQGEDRGATMTEAFEVFVRGLGGVMRQYLRTSSVDLLNVDVEGSEMEVLGDYPWAAYRPKVIAIEVLSRGFRRFLEEPVVKFLEQHGFVLASRLHCTAIFVDGERAVWR